MTQSICQVLRRVVCWKLLRVSLIIVVSIFVFTAVVFYLPPHWWQIVLGTFAFMFGSMVSLLTEEWKKGKWRKWARVALVSFIIAIAALLTTYAWNTWDNYRSERALLIAVAAEWRLNKAYIHVQSQRRDEYLTRDGHLSTPVFVLPTAREMRQVLTQATSFHHDRPLIHALTLYVMAADKLVPVLEHTDRLCSQPIATMEMKKKAVEMDLGKGKDSAFKYFIKSHEQLGDILTSRYQWSLEEAEARVGKELLEAIEQTWLVLPHDPNRTG